MKNGRRDQPSPDDSQDNKHESAAENPYAAPLATGPDAQTPPNLRPSSSGWATALKVFGFTVAGVLLIIVVGFGLLIGCCAMGAR